MDIDAIIAEAQTAQTAAEAPEGAPEASEVPQETEATEPVKEDVGSKPDSELTPEQLAKREANRRSHQTRKEVRLKRELRELREFQQKVLQQQQQQQPKQEARSGAPTPPKESDFQDWDSLRAAELKYFEDLADWKLEQKLSERDKKSTEVTQQAKQQEYFQERVDFQADKEAEFAKQVPEYMNTVYGQYGDFMQNLPKHVAQALIEADNAAPALLALATEGKLEDLADMSPYKVAMEIAKAEIRGEQYLNRNKVTNAPTPTRTAKGTGSYAKPLMDLPMEELLAKVSNR